MGRRQRHSKKQNLISEYHYDDKTKRYFKIAPNQFSCLTNLTKEKIAAQVLEEKRLNDLEKPLASKDGFKIRRFNRNTSMLDILYSRQCHSKISETSTYEINNCIFSHLKCQGHFNTSTLFDVIEGFYVKKLLLNRSQDKMMALCENGSSYSLNCASLKYSNTGLKLENNGSTEDGNGFSKIVNFERASDFKSEINDKIIDATWRTDVDCILFAKGEGFGEGSYVYLQDYMKEENRMKTLRCSVNEFIISGAWHESGKIALGVEKGVCLYDCLSGRVRSSSRTKVDPNALQVHCVTFSNEGNLLYYGAKGNVKIYDSRRHKAMHFVSANEKSRVDGVYLSRDGYYGMVNLCDGQILKYDLRMKKSVLSYEGHKNDYVKLPVHVNSTEEFVTAVGTDCYTRIWNFMNGKLLKVIPPPVPAVRPKFPAVSFLPQLSHVYTNTLPGLLLAIDEQMYIYT